ncbi:MAG: peptide-methionine (R)-S-oxide reductase [Bacteroidetes bacterium]|nr:MAG: peptide-methionine (R)-S-oxide reductase [Bacteroidota bacterium]
MVCLLAFTSCKSNSTGDSTTTKSQKNNDSMDQFEVTKTEQEWKQQLSPEQYAVLREKGTERPFTGKFEDHYERGTYTCAACGNELFQSGTKFDAGCGWPSFYEALDKTKILEKPDYSHGMKRIEIMCAKCGGHLGHVFDDGPRDKTGLRYCVNSLSLDFKKAATDSTQNK